MATKVGDIMHVGPHELPPGWVWVVVEVREYDRVPGCAVIGVRPMREDEEKGRGKLR